MNNRNFRDMLENQWSRGNFVCVGLDSEFEKIPFTAQRPGHECAVGVANTIVEFNSLIVKATQDLVCAYKPNFAFYAAYGDEGLGALHRTIHYIHAIAPNIPVILDTKVADIGNTNAGYVKMAFEYFGADAVTTNPYLGAEALQPFLAKKDKGVIVLCRTSNPGAGEFQDLEIPSFHCKGCGHVFGGRHLYECVAHSVACHWNKNGNCAVVAGATYPVELREVRDLVGDMPILIPGIGTQGGDVEKTVSAGKDSRGWGMIINSSSGIIFASKGTDFAEAARRETEKLRNLINQYR